MKTSKIFKHNFLLRKNASEKPPRKKREEPLPIESFPISSKDELFHQHVSRLPSTTYHLSFCFWSPSSRRGCFFRRLRSRGETPYPSASFPGYQVTWKDVNKASKVIFRFRKLARFKVGHCFWHTPLRLWMKCFCMNFDCMIVLLIWL